MDKKEKSGLNWVIAAGVVGADIGTSVFYGTGILFPIVGYLAPAFVLTACIMMWLFKRTYEEGLALSPYNGGAYSMILRSIGRRIAVVAGSLTFVSYLATASVSALSGAFYFSSLFGGLDGGTVVLLSFIPIVLFGLLNTRGIKEPAKLVTLIAGTHFFLLILIGLWGLGFIAFNWSEIDFAKMQDLKPGGEITLAVLMYGFAAAFLGITGFESAAQIVEELEAPALVTVRKLYKTVVILVSLTAPLISLLCLVLLSPTEVNNNLDYLLSGLGNKLGGKALLTIIVIDATLTLFAAVNTAFVGFIGLATTMAKQGNLPTVFLTRIAHRYPSIQGYPLIALPFALVSIAMAAIVAGEIGVVAKVYEISFLGVMVSFCLGVVLIRNKGLRRTVPLPFLSKLVFQLRHRSLRIPEGAHHWSLGLKEIDLPIPRLTNELVREKGDRVIPVPPLISGVILGVATITLFLHADSETLLMLTVLFAGTLLLMAYYRWGVLENRLESRSDLRLGLGRFASVTDLPEDLKKYILCTGGTGARRLINSALRDILSQEKEPFELIIFHAEEGKDEEGFFFELLQRVVSQQIAPIYRQDIILTVKILPGSLNEGLQTLKKAYDFERVIFGTGRDPFASQRLGEEVSKELEIEVTQLSGG